VRSAPDMRHLTKKGEYQFEGVSFTEATKGSPQ
jgi:hypothetical protein